MEKNFITNKEEVSQQNTKRYPVALRIPAQVISYIFHPLFIPVIAAWYLAFVHQGYFVGITPHAKLFIIIRIAYSTIFFPAFTVLLLKGLGFIDSIFLKTQRERIIPYVAANFFYFWIYLVFRSQHEVPAILTAFIFGVFLSSSVALIANSYFKISMHALGVGALSGLLILIIFTGSPYSVFLAAMIVFLITGLVCTSRLILGDHYPFDIYAGLFFGIICQVISAAFIWFSN
jgi:membrane-associated phospholipid phosphatase